MKTISGWPAHAAIFWCSRKLQSCAPASDSDGGRFGSQDKPFNSSWQWAGAELAILSAEGYALSEF